MYALLARAFCEEPDETFLDILESEHTEREFELTSGDAPCDLMALLAGIRSHIPQVTSSDGRDLQRLEEEYARIFLGPGEPTASPWESVYLTGKKTLFQPEVLSVRAAYREAALLPARYPSVSDDFIGLELDFMAKLSRSAYASLEAGDETTCALRLEQSLDFLRDHLLLWIDDLASNIREHQGDCFYSQMARLAACYLAKDATTLRI